MNTVQTKKTILTTFMEEIWNQGNFSQLDSFVAPTYEIKHDPGDPWQGQIINLDTFKTRVLYSRNAFPDLNFDIQEMVAEGDNVVAFWIMSGTHQGDLPNLPATGRPFSISGMTIYYFDENKVCGHTQAYDRLGFLGQIGFVN